MLGYKCDGPGCPKFAGMTMGYTGLFGTATPTSPGGWIIWNETPKQQSYTGLFGGPAPSQQEEQKMPPTFCSEVCCRDYLRAKTLIEGAAAS